jgi:para-nitrobenzyl esterase
LQGHSAGSISICLHLIAPASQGLFQRAIMESGGCDTIAIPLQQMEIIGDNITSYFCTSSSNVISCLQSIDAVVLLEYVQSQGYLNLYAENTIGPSIDGLIIPDSIIKLFEQNKFSKNISLLTGTTKDEFALFIAGRFEPGWQIENLNQTVLSQWVQIFSNGESSYLNRTYNPYIDPYVPPILVNYYGLTDALSTGGFQCPVRRVAAYLANNGNGSVYLYSFDYIPLSSPFVRLSQSVHGQELPFVFYTANASQLTQTIFPVNTFSENELLLASAMSLLWVRFIVNGNPNMPLNGETHNPLINQLNQLGCWPMYSTNTTANRSSYVIVSNVASRNGSATIRLSTSGYHSSTCAAWDQIVPNPNITKRCSIDYNGPNFTITNDSTLNTVSFIIFNLFSFLIYVLS